MPRQPRMEYEGAMYHVINRGNYRADLFATEGKRFRLHHKPQSLTPFYYADPFLLRPGIPILLNLQPEKSGKAKGYQIAQVRKQLELFQL